MDLKNQTVVQSRKSVSEARRDFPILSTLMNGHPLVFLDSAASSQKPESVIQAINRYYQTQNANVHRGVYSLSQRATDQFEQSRKKVAHFINAQNSNEVVFVRGATEAINLVAKSFGGEFFTKGGEILLSQMEHHSNIVPWQMIANQKGMTIRVIPVNDKGELIMEKFKAMLNESVQMVAINHISNSLGTINPVEEVSRLAHEFHIPVLIDGAQATAHGPVDVQKIGCDFYVFSAHKMFGPTGMGVLWGRENLLEKMPPWQGGGEMISTVSFEKTTYNELPFKFEAGTPHIAGAVGMGAAIDYLDQFDPNELREYEQNLLNYCTQRLGEIKGMKFYGTASIKASVVSFLIEGIHPYDLGIILDQMGVAVRTGHHCTQPLMDFFQIPGTVRASFALYNNREDIDKLAEATKKAAVMLR